MARAGGCTLIGHQGPGSDLQAQRIGEHLALCSQHPAVALDLRATWTCHTCAGLWHLELQLHAILVQLSLLHPICVLDSLHISRSCTGGPSQLCLPRQPHCKAFAL